MDKTKEKVLEEYLQFRRLKNHSRTIDDIKFHIIQFFEFSKKPLSKFDDKLLTAYVESITNKYSTQTLNTIKSSFLKNFIKWYYVDWSARFRNIDAILKQEKAQSSYSADDMLSEEDIKKLVQAEPSHFWKAYFLTLFYGGCRPVEVCNLQWKDIEFEKGDGGAFISIYSKKNKETFIKYVPQDVVFYLKELKSINKEWVFFNEQEGKPIHKKTPYRRITRLSEKVLGKRIDLYTMRHSIATIIYNKEGLKDSDVARQMGHTQSMKGKYVHNDKNKLREIARKIYMSPEELPPEKKHELELEIESLKKQISEINQKVQESFGEAIEKYARRFKEEDEKLVIIKK